MSRPIDYSRFDRIEDSDSEDDDRRVADGPSSPPAPLVGVAPAPAARFYAVTTKGSEPGRYICKNGRTGAKIYEWEQSLDEVLIYIEAPPGIVSASGLRCTIAPSRLTLGLAGVDGAYIDEPPGGLVRVDASSWYLDESVITVVLGKASKGVTWDFALRGPDGQNNGVDPNTRQEMMKEMMLESFVL